MGQDRLTPTGRPRGSVRRQKRRERALSAKSEYTGSNKKARRRKARAGVPLSLPVDRGEDGGSHGAASGDPLTN